LLISQSVPNFLTSALFGWAEFPPRSSIEDRLRELLLITRRWPNSEDTELGVFVNEAGECVNKSQFIFLWTRGDQSTHGFHFFPPEFKRSPRANLLVKPWFGKPCDF